MVNRSFYSLFFLLFNYTCLFGWTNDSLLVIQKQEEVFALNPYTMVHKDYEGASTYHDVNRQETRFLPIATENYLFSEDDKVDTYWFRVTIENATSKKLRYIIYFHPGLDTIELFVNGEKSGKSVVLSSLAPAADRPFNITQELCAPLVLDRGLNHVYFRVPNHSVWNKKSGSLIVNIAEENVFLNYFLRARTYQSFALGLISIILVLHFMIYLLLREKNFLLLVVNLFFTLFYLVLLKNVHFDLPLSTTQLSAMRYWLSPVGFLVCASSLVFIQSFLDSKIVDSTVYRLIKYSVLIGFSIVVLLILFKALPELDAFATLFGLFTYLLVLAISIRAFLKGNVIAPYIFFGYLFFGLPIFVFIFPLSFSDFRSNETDFFYFAEAIRSIVFAIGVADRFWRVQRNSIRVEQEKKQLSIDGLLRLKTQREGIMQDLHDSLGGQLSSISLALNRLKHETSRNAIEAIQELANGAISELRNSLWVLENESVSFADLEQRINTLLWQHRKVELAIEFQLYIDESLKTLSLPSSSAGHLFRIIQEATHNSIKHSKATSLVITFAIIESGFHLIIADNGIGFEKLKPIGEVGHYGLKNMAARAKQINGTFTLVTAPLKGVEILITLTDPFAKSN